MPAGKKELSRRFADYSDEALLRILTADRAQYRPEALELAGRELSHRGLSPPPPPPAAPPSVRVASHAVGYRRRVRPKVPYGLFDILFDAGFCIFAVWAVSKLNQWTSAMNGIGSVIFCAAFFGLLASLASLRERWRTRAWRD